MSSVTRTSFYRELSASLFSPARYATFAAFFALSAAFLSASLQIGEGKFWTLETLWTMSVAIPLPLLVSLVTMPLFAGERAAGTYNFSGFFIDMDVAQWNETHRYVQIRECYDVVDACSQVGADGGKQDDQPHV